MRGGDRRGVVRLLGASLIALQLLSPPASAAEPDEDYFEGVSPLDELDAPPDLRREKRAAARDSGRWIWAGVAAGGYGYDSNIHLSPDNAEPSGLAAYGAKLEGLRYLGLAHRLKLTLETSGTPYERTSDVSLYHYQGRLFYGYRPKDSRFSMNASVRVRHRNDTATNIDGEGYRRDYAYWSYRFGTDLGVRLTERQSLSLSYSLRRRDYAETDRLESIDSWKHTARIDYTVVPVDSLRLDAFYSFTDQRYVEETASNERGFELPGYPDEEHYFQRAGIDAQFQAADSLTILAGYAFNAKDDRFEGYESYAGHTVTLGFDWRPGPRWLLQTEVSFSRRDYEHRQATLTEELDYDKWTTWVRGWYRLSRHFALFAQYRFVRRDTNRRLPFLTYRDYEQHRTLAGLTVAY